MTTVTPEARTQLRRQMRQARRALSPLQQKKAAQALATNIRRARLFASAKRIAVYIASDGEIALQPFIELCWSLGKQVYLPVLHPVRHNRLWFTQYQPDTKMSLNKYRIPEPHFKRSHITASALDLVLLPLVAFDKEGGRMGMGGGYYDRTFAFTQSRHGLKGPKLIGVAHELQKSDTLPIAPWDVPLNGVITDKARYKI